MQALAQQVEELWQCQSSPENAISQQVSAKVLGKGDMVHDEMKCLASVYMSPMQSGDKHFGRMRHGKVGKGLHQTDCFLYLHLYAAMIY